MKKFNLMTSLFFILFSIFLSGCTKGDAVRRDPIMSFSCEAEISMNNDIIKCKVDRNLEGITEIQVTYPSELQGISYKWLGNMYSISYNSLSCDTETPSLPKNSFASSIVNVLNETAKQGSLTHKFFENGLTTYSGNCDSGKFDITVENSSGHIKNFEIQDSELKVSFSNYSKD